MPGYTLYGYPESGSAIVEIALVAAGIPFEMKDLDADGGALEAAEFRAINPRGQVPALIHPDGSVITEVPAILNHLADAHPDSGLAPPPGSSARAQHDRWLAFLHANLYEAVLRFFYSDRYTTDATCVPAVQAAAKDYIAHHWALFGEALGDAPFFAGDTPGGVDFLAWALTTWLEPEDVAAASPAAARLAKNVALHPGLGEVVARNT